MAPPPSFLPSFLPPSCRSSPLLATKTRSAQSRAARGGRAGGRRKQDGVGNKEGGGAAAMVGGRRRNSDRDLRSTRPAPLNHSPDRPTD